HPFAIHQDRLERAVKRAIRPKTGQWKTIALLTPEVRVFQLSIEEQHAIAERRNVIGVVGDPQQGRVVVDAVTAPDSCFAIAKRVPGETHARRQVVVIPRGNGPRYLAAFRIVVTVKEESRGSVQKDFRADAFLVIAQVERLVTIQRIADKV